MSKSMIIENEMYLSSPVIVQATTMTLKIGSFVINCKDFDKTYKFWQEALHYVPRRPPAQGWVVLKDPTGTSPNVSVNQTEELKFGRNRMHLDLYANDQKAEVERLIKLGATIHKPAKQGQDFVIMADPEGKLFCVIQIPHASNDKSASAQSI